MSEDTLLREFQLRLKLKNIKFEENDGKADRKAVPRADPFREFRRQLEQRDIGTEWDKPYYSNLPTEIRQKILSHTADFNKELHANPGLDCPLRRKALTDWARQLRNTNRSIGEDLEFMEKEWRTQVGLGFLDLWVEAVAGLIRFLNVILARGRDKSSPTWKADVQTFVTKIRSAHRRIEWDPS